MKHVRIVVSLFAAILLGGCGVSTPGPSASATPEATVTVTPSPEPLPTATATATPFAFPMKLKEIGHLGGEATALALSGDRLYVKTGRDHFIVVDVSNPYRPKQIGASHLIEGGISTIAAYENILLIGDATGHVLAFDVSDDETPALIKTIDAGEPVEEMIVDGAYAYAAARSAGGIIIDMAAGGGPTIAATVKVEGKARRVAKTGNLWIIGSVVPGPQPTPTFYEGETQQMADDTFIYIEGGLMSIFDVADPAKPALLSQKNVSARFDLGRMQTVNQLVVLEDYGGTYDLSDPKNPISASSHTFMIDAVAGKYTIGFNEYHEEAPTHQEILDVYPIDSSNEYLDQFWAAAGPLDHVVSTLPRLAVSGHILYLADGDVLRVYDLSGPPFLVDQSRQHLDPYLDYPQIGTFDADAGTRPPAGGMYFYPPAFGICGDFLYTGSGYWKLDEPGSPGWVSKKAPGGSGCEQYGFRVKDGIFSQQGGENIDIGEDGRQWVYSGGGTLTFRDLSKPDQPRTTNVVLTEDRGDLAAVTEDRAYFMALDDLKKPQHSILEVFDIRDRRQPKLLGKSEPQPLFYGQYDKIKVIGGYLVWEHYEGAQMTIVLDARDPANIQNGRGDSDTGVLNIDATLTRGEYAFSYNGDQLKVYRSDHLSEPLAVLNLPEGIDPSGYGTPLQLFGDKVYANGAIVDIADPTQPKVVAWSERIPYEIEAHGDTYYFNMLNDGIGIYQLVGK